MKNVILLIFTLSFLGSASGQGYKKYMIENGRKVAKKINKEYSGFSYRTPMSIYSICNVEIEQLRKNDFIIFITDRSSGEEMYLSLRSEHFNVDDQWFEAEVISNKSCVIINSLHSEAIYLINHDPKNWPVLDLPRQIINLNPMMINTKNLAFSWDREKAIQLIIDFD